jgi:hypothetical protein
MIAAVLALGCAGQQAETRTTTAAQRGSAAGGGDPDSTASNEQAPSQRPSSAAGSQDPHPVATNPDDPKYGGDESARGEVARPGLEGRPGMPREGSASATGSAAGRLGEVKELPEVYGQVNEVSDDEIEIEPAYGEPIKLKLNEQTMAGDRQAGATALQEGDEVRASYDGQGDDKVAVELRTGAAATPVEDTSAPSSAPMKSEPSERSDTTGGGTTR